MTDVGKTRGEVFQNLAKQMLEIKRYGTVEEVRPRLCRFSSTWRWLTKLCA